ncbi:LysE family translocator [Hyphomicrobium sp.]|uniref:LysE family translocator n=1 Tax=Hyphomicrobium sp. TaxID=82 RepID=UPI000F928F4D|nr:LysE family translocator [Hyphomicrobium sp.]RUO99104.1 MAG: LysE family translocator [Hyphomicrobium sp.]
MSHDLLISLIAFALVTAMTPGPNNTMLLASGVNFGFVRTQPHILGVVIGFTIMMLAVAFGVGRIFSVFPPLYSLLRTISIAYLLWLAWRIGTSGATDPVPGDEARPMTFTEAALFQWINPKGWMVCLSVAANYVTPDNLWADVAVLSAVFLIVSLLSATSWALFGTSLRPFLKDERSMRIFNIAMAIALVASLSPILREMF